MVASKKYLCWVVLKIFFVSYGLALITKHVPLLITTTLYCSSSSMGIYHFLLLFQIIT